MKRFFLLLLVAIALAACGEDPSQQLQQEPGGDRLTTVEESRPKEASAASTTAVVKESSGGVTARIVPEKPATSDCLRVIAQGNPGRGSYQWTVNGQIVPKQVSGQLCGEHFKRGDQVQVMVGTKDQGASVSIVIGNSPPQVVDISATPEHVSVGVPIEVFPVAEDLDDDEVEFTYQWLIDGEEDSFLTESVLPAESFRAGNSVQVMITPFDGHDKGPVYQSYAMTIVNTPPQITSAPPHDFKSLDYNYQVTATDPDGDQLKYSLEEAPEGMVIDVKTGLISWPLTGVQPGSYKVSIIVEDSSGNQQYQEFDLNLGAAE